MTGIEPATNYPNFKSFERQRECVKVLPPGGRGQCTWSIEAFDTKAGVDHVLAEIATLQRSACDGASVAASTLFRSVTRRLATERWNPLLTGSENRAARERA